jgi:hypothetical protein
MNTFYYHCSLGHFEGFLEGCFPLNDALCPHCGLLMLPVAPPPEQTGRCVRRTSGTCRRARVSSSQRKPNVFDKVQAFVAFVPLFVAFGFLIGIASFGAPGALPGIVIGALINLGLIVMGTLELPATDQSFPCDDQG